MLASKMLRVKGKASSAVAVSEENLFSTRPARQQERIRKLVHQKIAEQRSVVSDHTGVTSVLM